ncbi:MAG: RNA polymerase sigma factor [Clostridia bacterium]|nr:RNA polymerase sigma factor [Clostridia bacterium]
MNDKEIISMFFARDQRAVAETKDKYGNYAQKLSVRILADPYDAEECVNDAYLSLWNSIPPNRPRDLGAFFCRIVRNLSIDRLRRDTAKKRGADICAITDELAECLPGADSAEDAYIKDQLRQCLDRFYKKLSARDRDIFFNRYYFARSSSDIAEKFGLSEEYVRTLLSRMRNKLKDHLGSEGYR